MATVFDHKGRNARKWQQIRRKLQPSSESRGLSGAALEQAVMAMAAADSTLVKIQGA